MNSYVPPDLFDVTVDRARSLAGAMRPESRYIIPEFRERTSTGDRIHNPYTKLFEERIIFLGVQIDDVSANDVMAQLLDARVDGSRPRHPALHQLTGRLVHRADGDLRHDAVHPARGADDLHGPGGLGGGGHPGGRRQGQADRAAELADLDPPALQRGRRPGQRHRDRRPGDPSDARRCWSSCWPSTPGRTEAQVRIDIERDKILTAEEAVEYGLIDEVIVSRKLTLAAAK